MKRLDRRTFLKVTGASAGALGLGHGEEVHARSAAQARPARSSITWLVGGGSGHGYKHGIMFGEYVARRVAGKDTPSDLKEVLALKPQTF